AEVQRQLGSLLDRLSAAVSVYLRQFLLQYLSVPDEGQGILDFEVEGRVIPIHGQGWGSEVFNSTGGWRGRERFKGILEALAVGVQQLQDLQAKAMKKDGNAEDSPEVVKTATVALPELAPPLSETSGLQLQDWLVQITTSMQDLSSGSGDWWEYVREMVTETYGRWLAATPLERLQIFPVDHQRLASGRWTRVNLRACALMMQSFSEVTKADLIARRSTQSAVLMLFRVYTMYQPGGTAERGVVLKWLQRCKDMNMTVPDGSLLARTQLVRSTYRIDGQPKIEDVVRYQQTYGEDYHAGNSDLYYYLSECQGLSKMERAKKCLCCGAEVEPDGEISPTKASDGAVASGQPVLSWEALLQAAAKVAGGVPVSEPKAPSMRVMSIHGGSPAGLDGEAYALVDSGATHPLRRARTGDEWNEANPVVVHLAGGEVVELRMNAAGTLLVPATGATRRASSSPIVPLGSLVGVLGYKLEWHGSRCKLTSREDETITLRVRDGCPEITERQALELISRIEDQKLAALRSATAATKTMVRESAMSLNKSWFDHLISYCRSGIGSEALMAIHSASFFQDLPSESLYGLSEADPISNGWDALRGLQHLNRKTRKKLWSSKQWVAHLYAGKTPNEEVMFLERQGFAVLELDLERGKSHDVRDPLVWRALEWAARTGRIASIIGGPPQNTFMLRRNMTPGPEPLRSPDCLYGGWYGQSEQDVHLVNKHTGLFVRMIYLHALATAGRCTFPPEPNDVKEVGFLLEQPRDPRSYMLFTDPLAKDSVSFWRTGLWIQYKEEAGLSTFSFDMSSLGKALSRQTTVGTNLPLRHLHGLRGRIQRDAQPAVRAPPSVWTKEFSEVVSIAVREQRLSARMLRMSAEQWKEHVRRGHLPFRPDCMTCVTAGATGRRHARVEHPSCFVLSADVSGPLKVPGLDADARGAFPKPYKYMFVAKLTIPKTFVDDGRGEDAFDYEDSQEPVGDPAPPDGEELPVDGEVRIVACGNMMADSGEETYAGAAPAEVVRSSLSVASLNGWDAAVLDVTAAFLQTPLSEVQCKQRILGQPPRALVRAGLCGEKELWEFTHAVYGLRESPRWWGEFRDEKMAQLNIVVGEKRIKLLQCRVEGSWWRLLDDTVLVGLVVIYVDDLLICSTPDIIKAVSRAVRKLWDTSELSWASDGGIRFLGIEIVKVDDGFALNQEPYIRELTRIHSIPATKRDLIPVAKEQASFVIEPEEAVFTSDELKAAQQLAGEILWLAQRTAPRRSAAIAKKCIGFLQGTSKQHLWIRASSKELIAWTDRRLLTGDLRRSARQSTITLSTAESELAASVEGALALLSAEALLSELNLGKMRSRLRTDSTSSVAIQRGSGSWRTRHLRIKAGWIYERLQAEDLELEHWPGDLQLADMLTKPLSSIRLRSLAQMTGLMPLEEILTELGKQQHSTSSGSSSALAPSSHGFKVLVAMMVLSQAVVGSEATELTVYEPIVVDRTLLAWCAFVVVALLWTAAWELIVFCLDQTSMSERQFCQCMVRRLGFQARLRSMRLGP
ncbi:GIP, partial [Symbiodinium sp. CCMP2456]